jgi:hypothetical protein
MYKTDQEVAQRIKPGYLPPYRSLRPGFQALILLRCPRLLEFGAQALASCSVILGYVVVANQCSHREILKSGGNSFSENIDRLLRQKESVEVA